MTDCEQRMKDLKAKFDLLNQVVHEMNEMIHELRGENQNLKKIIEGSKNE